MLLGAGFRNRGGEFRHYERRASREDDPDEDKQATSDRLFRRNPNFFVGGGGAEHRAEVRGKPFQRVGPLQAGHAEDVVPESEELKGLYHRGLGLGLKEFRV